MRSLKNDEYTRSACSARRRREDYARICVLRMNVANKHLVTLMSGADATRTEQDRNFHVGKYDEIISA